MEPSRRSGRLCNRDAPCAPRPLPCQVIEIANISLHSAARLTTDFAVPISLNPWMPWKVTAWRRTMAQPARGAAKKQLFQDVGRTAADCRIGPVLDLSADAKVDAGLDEYGRTQECCAAVK